MISEEQAERVKKEMIDSAAGAVRAARIAEHDLESYSYPINEHERRQYSPARRDVLLAQFREADYLAESRSWIANLILRELSHVRQHVPPQALCFFKDGDMWCCVNGDFINLQESPAGFGATFDDALNGLKAARSAVV